MRHTVLLVDDDRRLLDALRRSLHHQPYEIVVASDAAEAFAVLAARPVSVVVSDETMPAVPGTEFLARVRVAYPDTVRIMLTGHASVDVAVRSINEGAVYRFLTKPCHPGELALTIRQALEQRELFVKSRRLLETVRRQSAAMDALEREVRGITRVERDESGAIVLGDAGSGDLNGLLCEIERELEAAERRLRSAGEAPATPGTLF